MEQPLIDKSSDCYDRKGNHYKWEIKVETVVSKKMFPEGVKARFRLLRLHPIERRKDELIILIDNHAPYGFHEHDKLPRVHDSRKKLCIADWKHAFDLFQKKCREILR